MSLRAGRSTHPVPRARSRPASAGRRAGPAPAVQQFPERFVTVGPGNVVDLEVEAGGWSRSSCGRSRSHPHRPRQPAERRAGRARVLVLGDGLRRWADHAPPGGVRRRGRRAGGAHRCPLAVRRRRHPRRGPRPPVPARSTVTHVYTDRASYDVEASLTLRPSFRVAGTEWQYLADIPVSGRATYPVEEVQAIITTG